MLELELENAICRCFASLFPDLHKAGFRIRSQQAVLLGRRLDLLLENAHQEVMIMELKAGCPPMPDVRDQTLDYCECWRQSFPDWPTPRLMVVANTIPSRTALELANFGIESRAISLEQCLCALRNAADWDPDVEKGLKLIPRDLDKVRYLLSDFESITTPKGLKLCAPWTHEKVFLALVKRGEKHKEPWMKNIYVQLYPQRPNCAVLYGPHVKAAAHGPLHLNDRAKSWDATVFAAIREHLRFVLRDNKGKGRENHNFDHYAVTNWDGLARGLGLEVTPKASAIP